MNLEIANGAGEDYWILGLRPSLASRRLTLYPPSTTNTCAAAKEAESEQRNKTMSAIASGRAAHPIGEFANNWARMLSFSNQCLVMPVSTNPGASALIRIPLLAQASKEVPPAKSN